ncbi:MAG: type II secretion system protein GspJ [Verrucomicrobiota bacterium]|jgi:type II secretion system protein J|nr:type II secretion system protein GspJ [Verrucomicrobiota bacterium]
MKVGFDASFRARQGFTLLEILVASVAFAMIVMVIKVTLMESMDLRDRRLERMEKMNTRMRLIEIMQVDLRQCLLTETDLAPSFLGDSSNGGIQRADQLEFYACSGVILTNQPWGHLQKIRYYLGDPMDDGREELPEGMSLYRETTRNLLASSQQTIQPMPIANGLASLAFQYYDGTVWHDNWDSASEVSKLPVAVRIRLEFVDDSEDMSSIQAAKARKRGLSSVQTTVALMATPKVDESEDAEMPEEGS